MTLVQKELRVMEQKKKRNLSHVLVQLQVPQLLS